MAPGLLYCLSTTFYLGFVKNEKYIMLSTLISGLRQLGNDIYVYLRPLVDDLKALWSEGVKVWDQYKREYFTLHAMLFVTINDLPVLHNLSGQNKRKCEAYTYCLDDTCSLRLNNSKKKNSVHAASIFPSQEAPVAKYGQAV